MTTATLHCPAWCDGVHGSDPCHVHTVMRQEIAAGDDMVVGVEKVSTQPATVWLEVADVLTPEEAERFAAAIVEAARLAGVTR